MTGRTFSQRMQKTLAAVALGGVLFQLSGCDPEVRSTLLSGLEQTSQSLSSALITAFFQSLQTDDTSGSSSLTTGQQ
ncbi:MAG: hypothetical protein D6788_01755 [Planctomycetota bacterium]|nr:MAG: hypothetical protein D6788_01755 [Planctomycetota bacterium]